MSFKSNRRRDHSNQQQEQRNRQIAREIANNFIFGRKQQQQQKRNNQSNGRKYNQNFNNYLSPDAHNSDSATNAQFDTISLDVNKDIRDAVKPIDVKSVDLSVSTSFPIKDINTNVLREFGDQSSNDISMTYKCCKHLFVDLVQTVKIDNSELMEQMLEANDVSEQIELFCQNVAINEVDHQNRVKIKDNLQQLLCENGFRCEFHFYGSTVNKLGFRDSDIDLFIELNPDSSNGDKQQHRYDFKTAMDYLATIHRILRNHLKKIVRKPIASKLCPIIKLNFNKISSDRKETNIVCDLNLSNRLGVHNSKLISYYCEFEPRFRKMALILRYWAKINGFIGTQGFSSYAFGMLCVFFAQNTSPPLLPSVDSLMNASNHPMIIDGWECGFSDDNLSLIVTHERNTETVTELIAKFFKYYSRFDFETQVICPKSGQSVQRSEFVRQNQFNLNTTANTSNTITFKLTSFCCIQDPFNLQHNITAKCRRKAFDKFCELIHYIANNDEKVFVIKQNCEQNTDKYWGIARLITKFDDSIDLRKTY